MPLKIFLNAGLDADEEYLDLLTRKLLKQISNLEIKEVSLSRTQELPNGAMGQPVDIGAIVTTGIGPAISGLATVLQSWVSRAENRSITLKFGDSELSVSGISKEEQSTLIEEFLNRYSLTALIKE